MPTGATELRKLAAIMFTDMVGYSALAQHNEALSLELLEEHRVLLRQVFPRFNGIEVKTIGDAFLVEFHSALEAVQCAIEMQRALAKRNHDVVAERRIEIKIGIHLGDVVHRDGDVYGDGVNVASRIEPLAGAGGICISTDVERQIRTSLGSGLERIGAKELKNIKVPMELYRVVLPWARSAPAGGPVQVRRVKNIPPVWIAVGLLTVLVLGGGWFLITKVGSNLKAGKDRTKEASDQPRLITSIAVLPFQNYSHDPEQDYFADGITELLCADLAGISALKKVTSRTTVMQYKNTTNTARQIAAQLGVDALVEGSVQRESNRVLLTVQLIDGATEGHLWGTNYMREVASVLELKTEMAEAIAREIRARLTPAERSRFARQPAVAPATLDAYLKGRHYIETFQFEEAKAAFEQSVVLDPSYARGYAALAGWHVGGAFLGRAPPRQMFEKVREYSAKALSLDDSLPEALECAAWGKLFLEWDWASAEQLLRRAVELSPNNSSAHIALGFQLTAVGRFEEAYSEMKRGQELDPLSWNGNVWVPTPLWMAGQYDRAAQEATAVLKRSPGFFPVLETIANVHAEQGKYDEALSDIQAIQKQPQISPRIPALLGYVQARSGNTAEAKKILEQLKTRLKDPYPPTWEIAVVLTALGEKAEAIAWLGRAYEERVGGIYLVNVNPTFASLRNEPEFKALMKKMNLVPLP